MPKSTQNMQRLRRGEMTRMKPQKATHTDVHMGTTNVPGATQVQQEDPAIGKLKKRVEELEEEARC